MCKISFLRRSHNLYQIFKGMSDSKWFLKVTSGLDVYPDDFCHSSLTGNHFGLISESQLRGFKL